MKEKARRGPPEKRRSYRAHEHTVRDGGGGGGETETETGGKKRGGEEPWPPRQLASGVNQSAPQNSEGSWFEINGGIEGQGGDQRRGEECQSAVARKNGGNSREKTAKLQHRLNKPVQNRRRGSLGPMEGELAGN